MSVRSSRISSAAAPLSAATTISFPRSSSAVSAKMLRKSSSTISTVEPAASPS